MNKSTNYLRITLIHEAQVTSIEQVLNLTADEVFFKYYNVFKTEYSQLSLAELLDFINDAINGIDHDYAMYKEELDKILRKYARGLYSVADVITRLHTLTDGDYAFRNYFLNRICDFSDLFNEVSQ